MDVRAAVILLSFTQAGLTFGLCTLGLGLDPLRSAALSALAVHPLVGAVSLLLCAHVMWQAAGPTPDAALLPAFIGMVYVQFLRLTPESRAAGRVRRGGPGVAATRV